MRVQPFRPQGEPELLASHALRVLSCSSTAIVSGPRFRTAGARHRKNDTLAAVGEANLPLRVSAFSAAKDCQGLI